MRSVAGGSSYFWLRRLHSLLGLFPFALFLVVHFTFNSFILAGPDAFTEFVESSQGFPLIVYLELGLLAVPIAFHIILGAVIIYSGQANIVAYGTYRNWMYVFQRLTGIIVVPFVIYHVWMTRMQAVFTGHHVDARYMHDYLAPFGTKVFYIVGVLAAVFHLANGLATALMTWGITWSRRSQYAVTILSWIIFVGMGAWGVRLVFAF